MDEFILRAWIAGLILAVMLGPLGAFVVWRRMAYTGDAMAHASLLGVALALATHGAVPMPLALLLVAGAVAYGVSHLGRHRTLPTDTLLGIFAHGALALGMVLIALNPEARVDINSYLFGDLLAVGWAQVITLAGLMLLILAVLRWRWRRLLIATLDPGIARVEGITPHREHGWLMGMLAGVIGLAIPLTGALLITALLIIPAAAARRFATTPHGMALLASMIGALSVSGGLASSLTFDTPTAPSMVVIAAAIAGMSALIPRKHLR